MDRTAKLRTSPFAIAATALMVALVFVALPAGALAAAPAAPAADEYSIDLAGVTPSTVASTPADLDSPRAAAKFLPQAGVVGEASPPQSPLDALGSSLGDTPLVVLVALLMTALLPFAARRRAQRA